MKMTVSESRCMGHGQCYAVAPDLLSFDDEGYVSIRGTTVDVAVELESQARAAASACPEAAIEIE
jgi:ferredoxin